MQYSAPTLPPIGGFGEASETSDTVQKTKGTLWYRIGAVPAEPKNSAWGQVQFLDCLGSAT
jgi:hypothetical protein